jgi:predicted histidine transporter YuiF (NhaC family)
MTSSLRIHLLACKKNTEIPFILIGAVFAVAFLAAGFIAISYTAGFIIVTIFGEIIKDSKRSEFATCLINGLVFFTGPCLVIAFIISLIYAIRKQHEKAYKQVEKELEEKETTENLVE